MLFRENKLQGKIESISDGTQIKALIKFILILVTKK
jgi:hypothetical protein